MRISFPGFLIQMASNPFIAPVTRHLLLLLRHSSNLAGSLSLLDICPTTSFNYSINNSINISQNVATSILSPIDKLILGLCLAIMANVTLGLRQTLPLLCVQGYRTDESVLELRNFSNNQSIIKIAYDHLSNIGLKVLNITCYDKSNSNRSSSASTEEMD